MSNLDKKLDEILIEHCPELTDVQHIKLKASILGLIEKEVIGPNHTKQDYGKLQNDDNPFEALMRIKLFDAEDTVRDKQRLILKGGNK